MTENVDAFFLVTVPNSIIVYSDVEGAITSEESLLQDYLFPTDADLAEREAFMEIYNATFSDEDPLPDYSEP